MRAPHGSSLGRRTALAAAIAMALPSAASGAVARVDFAIGQVFLVDSGGQQIRVRKGATIESGQMVRTKRGRAQLRFTDGAFVSLKPETDFRVDEYRFSGEQDGSERGFFSLLKGGLRTLTGLIGKKNSGAYKIETPVATIGIRGSGMDCALDEGISCSVFLDTACLTTNVNTGCASKGQVMSATSREGEVRITDQNGQKPSDDDIAGVDPDYSEAEELDCNGNSCVIPQVVVSDRPDCGSGNCVLLFTTSGFGLDGGEGFLLGETEGVGGLRFDDDLALTGYSGEGGKARHPFGGVFDFGGGSATSGDTLVEGGSAQFVTWTRWSSDSPSRQTTGDIIPHAVQLFGGESFHLVAGVPTPSLPAGTASFVLLGATSPTSASGDVASLDSASLEADFTNASVQFDAQFTFGAQANDFIEGTYVIDAPLSIPNPFFSNASSFGGIGNFTTSFGGPSGGACDGGEGCGTTVAGQFFGPNAVQAGLVFEIENHLIDGAAAFRRK